jgi:hypothetical protein
MGKRNQVGRKVITIRQFKLPNEVDGELVTVAIVKRMVYHSTYVGPEKLACSHLPLRRKQYFWIEYLECRWQVEQDGRGRYVLRLPGQTVLDDLLNAM